MGFTPRPSVVVGVSNGGSLSPTLGIFTDDGSTTLNDDVRSRPPTLALNEYTPGVAIERAKGKYGNGVPAAWLAACADGTTTAPLASNTLASRDVGTPSDISPFLLPRLTATRCVPGTK